MSEPKTCPQCGGAIPESSLEGRCPRCMLRAGLGVESESFPASSRFEGDRNLLFGVFAVQLRKVSPQEIMAAAGAWAADASKDLPTRLREQSILTQSDVDFIARLVDEAVRAHSGDIEAALNTLGGAQVLQATFGNSIDLTQHRLGAAAGSPVFLDGRPLDPDSVPGVQETPGRYTHVSEHARGGMGRVLLVHDGFLGRNVALKELMPGQRPTSDPDNPSTPVRQYMGFLSRFLQEARITGQLEHPSIVPVYELGHRQDGTLYYTMKLVRGKTLREAINQSKTIRDRLSLLAHFVDLCQAIAYAHSRGIVHRDIKPDNVMVGEFGETVVLDWGLAKAKDREDCHADGLAETIRMLQLGDVDSALKTQYGQVMGTPGYMSPEQALGRISEVEEKSDVYSLGAVLYQMLAGRPPFTGKSVPEILQKVVDDEPEPLDPNTVPLELAAICRKAMDKRADQRYGSAKALAQEIQQFLTGGLISAYEYRFSEHLYRFIKKHKAIVTITSAAAIVLFSVIGVAVSRIDAARRHAEELLYYASAISAARDIENDQPIDARESLQLSPKRLRGWEWGFLTALSHPQPLTLRDDLMPLVDSGAFSPDGSLIATGANKGAVRIWDANTGDVKRRLTHGDITITCVSFSRDGSYLLGSNWQGKLALWNVNTGEKLLELDAGTKSIRQSAIDPAGTMIAGASNDGHCYLWELSSGKLRAKLEIPGLYGMNSVAFSPDGRLLATGTSNDGALRIWDVETSTEIRHIKAHEEHVGVVMFDNSGKRIVSSGGEDIVRVWNWESGELLREFKDQWCGVFTPDGEHVLTNDVKEGHVITWNVSTGATVQASDKMPDIKRIWADVPSQRLIVPMPNAEVQVRSLHPRNDVLKLAGANWNPVFSPDSRLVATRVQGAGSQHRVVIWDAATGTVIRSFDGYYNIARAFSFLPDSDRIVVVNGSRACVWRVSDGTLLQRFRVSDYAGHVAVAPDGKTMLVTYQGLDGQNSYRGEVWNIDTGESISKLGQWPEEVDGYFWPRAFAYDPRGGVLALATVGNEVIVRGVASPKETFRLTVKADVSSLAFSPDGEWLAVSADGVTIWHAQNGNQVAALQAASGGICFSPDGTRLVAGADIWDTRTWQILLEDILRSDGAGDYAVFSPDARTLATALGDVVTLWRAFPWDAQGNPDTAPNGDLGLLDAQRKGRDLQIHERLAELAPRAACERQLRAIDKALLELAGAKSLEVGAAPPAIEELSNSTGSAEGFAACPAGGEYALPAVGGFPKCTVHGSLHVEYDALTEDFELAANGTNLYAIEVRRARLEAVLPRDWVVVVNCGILLIERTRPPRPAAALVVYEKALELASGNYEKYISLWELARARMKVGDLNGAIDGFRGALKYTWSESREIEVEINLADALIERGTGPDIQEACEIIARQGSQAPVRYKRQLEDLNELLASLRSIEPPQEPQLADVIRKTLDMFPGGTVKNEE